MKSNRKDFFVMLSSLLLFAFCFAPSLKAAYDVIPLPQSVQIEKGKPFVLNKSTLIVYPKNNEGLRKAAAFLSAYLQTSLGFTLAQSDRVRSKNVIELGSDFTHPNKEAYRMSVDAQRIKISGSTDAGTFYGIQCLRKTVAGTTQGAKIALPAAVITDYPRFEYRGMMLDVCRHFFPVAFIKQYIDVLALHNINRFHWHLTDDQGWRVEIKKYPKLTQIASQRKETVIGKSNKFDGKPHGGFYTQEQIKEIVAYAQERYITIIPEVDIPGHACAALAAYPELGCTGGPYEVETRWGVFSDVLCLGKPKTFQFLQDVFSELIELFPSTYIHVGGDECPKDKWHQCSDCLAKMTELGLVSDEKHSAEEKLQSYCIATVEKMLKAKGRRIIGWDEILQGGLAPDATVMSWQGDQGGIAAARLKHQVIMAPNEFRYFDHYQSKPFDAEPLSIGGFLPLDKVYNYEPIPKVLTAEERPLILGTQANLWTEYIPTQEHVLYMLLPRMDALAETQWTLPEKKDFNNFLTRLPVMLKLYNTLGYNYSKNGYTVSPQ